MNSKIYTIFLVLLLTGWKSKKYFNLESLDESAEFHNGLQIAVIEDSTFSSTINFEGQYGNHLVFYTYFENNSSDTLTIDPGEFEYQYFNFGTDIKVSEPFMQRKAYDPEIQIKAMNTALNSNEDEKAALTF